MVQRGFRRPLAIACAAIAAILTACAGSIGSASAQGAGLEVETRPTFLVATRELEDPIFAHTVILMIPPLSPPEDPRLVAGLIINKPSRMTLRDVFPDVSSLKDRTDSVFFGGPVDYSSACVLTREAPASGKAIRVIDGVYLSLDRDSVAKALKIPPARGDIRFIMGRAQWSRDQLHSEIQEGSWYSSRASAEQVFSADPKELWQKLVSHSGTEVRWDRAERRFALLLPPE